MKQKLLLVALLAVLGLSVTAAPREETISSPNGKIRLVVTVGDQLMGQRWGDAHDPYTLFWSIMPPNAPTCARGNENSVRSTASSYHSGGVNVCMGDGAVKFVSDTVNCGDLSKDTYEVVNDKSRPQDYGGKSIYGVWGAMGSAAGGETTSSL